MGYTMSVAAVPAPLSENLAAEEQLTQRLRDRTELGDEEKVRERENVRLRFVFGQRLDAALAEMNEEELFDFGERHLSWFTTEEVTAPTEEKRAMIRQNVMIDIEKTVINYSREVATILFGEKLWLVTGGMADSDGPTDAYDMLNRIDELALTENSLTLDEYAVAVAYEKGIRDAS